MRNRTENRRTDRQPEDSWVKAYTLSARHGHSLVTTVMRLVAICAVSLAVSGCISLNTVQSEGSPSAPPDLSRVCAYSWNNGETLLRTENLISYGWASPASFGYGATLPHVEQLTANCPIPRPERTANLSVYYLEHSSKVYNAAVLAPLILASGYTLGIAPVPFFRNYVACVQTTSPDGLNRFAIAEGSISTLANVWGQSNTRHYQGKTETFALRAKLLQDLTSQAWHKLWSLQDENLGAEDCRHRLEAMVGRSESRDHKSQ